MTAVREVNLLALAAANGVPDVLDPTVAQILSDINKATSTFANGVINQRTDPNTMDYVWQSPATRRTAAHRQDRLQRDRRHRLSGSFNREAVKRDPDHLNGDDVAVPGLRQLPPVQIARGRSRRALRSTLSSTLVNELRGGRPWGTPLLRPFDQSNGPATFEPFGGFAIEPAGHRADLDLTELASQNGRAGAARWSCNIDDTVSWQKGQHSLSFGGALFFGNAWENAQQIVPDISFGIERPTIRRRRCSRRRTSLARRTTSSRRARDLFALLTGRVNTSAARRRSTRPRTSTSTSARASAPGKHERVLGSSSQDSWRVTPSSRSTPACGGTCRCRSRRSTTSCRMSTFADACGVSGIGANGDVPVLPARRRPAASLPTFVQFTDGHPGLQHRLEQLRAERRRGVEAERRRTAGCARLLGDPDQATLRAGFSVAVRPQGMGVFTGQLRREPRQHAEP